MKNLFNSLTTGLLLILLTLQASGQTKIKPSSSFKIKDYCVLNISNSIIDTTSLYIIQGSIKTNNTGNQIVLATLAMNNNATAILSKEYAAKIKFRFSGFHNSNNTIPTYNIVFVNNSYCLTEKTNSLPFGLIFDENADLATQKWILKQNDNGSYSIFNAGGSSLSCTAIGSPPGLGPTLQQPSLRFNFTFNAGNQFQQFQLIKLE